MSIVIIDGYEVDFPADSNGFADNIYLNVGDIDYISGGTGDGVLEVETDLNSLASANLIYSVPSQTEYYISFHMWIDPEQQNQSYGYYNTGPFVFLYSTLAEIQCIIGIKKNGQVAVINHSGTTINDTGDNYLTFGKWHHLCIHVATGAASSGVIRLWVDGNLWITNAAADIFNGAGNIGTVQLGMMQTGLNNSEDLHAYFDNFIVNNTSGSVANGQINGAIIQRLDPDSDGTYTAWSENNSEANHYSGLDETASYGTLPDDEITMSWSDTPTQAVSLNVESPSAGTILGVAIRWYGHQSINAAQGIQAFYRNGAGDIDYSQIYFGPDWDWQFHYLADDNGSPWSSITGLEIGLEV